MLPSRRDLATTFGVDFNTIQRALSPLVNDGTLRADAGRGTFVAERDACESGVARRSPQAGSSQLINRTVAIVSGTPAQSFNPSAPWSNTLTSSSFDEICDQGYHALAIHPSQVTGSVLDNLIAERVCGVIIPESVGIDNRVAWASCLKSAGTPVVVVGCNPRLSDFDRVYSDHEAGSYELTKWIIEQEHRRIAPFWPYPGTQDFLALRYQGYERAMIEAGLTPRKPIMWSWHNIAPIGEEGFNAVSRLAAGYLAPHLIGPEAPDALLVASDGETWYATEACRLLDRRVHDDILITGYDNYWRDAKERAFETNIPAATVDKLDARIGAEAVRLLMDRIVGRLKDSPQCRIIEPKLIVENEPG
jgi:DNA-binding LacI/PurR family transcriptional regulator